MAIQGLRDTSDYTAGGDRAERPESWREGILVLFPNGKAPLTALTTAMKTRKTDDPRFHWFEKSMPDQRMTLDADITNVATTFTVASGASAVKAGHIIRMEETDELILVTTQPTTDVTFPVVTRGYGATTGTAITVAGSGVNPNIHIVGNANEEGSLAPDGISYDPTEQDNFCQIFRNTYEATRTAQRTRLRSRQAVVEARREALELHSIEMEKAFWFGTKSSTTQNGRPLRATEGFFETMSSRASANVVTAGTPLGVTLDDFEDWMEQIFRFGSSEKMAFCGNLALLGLNQAVRKGSSFNIETGIKEFGMNVSRLITPFGTIVLKSHPLFNQLTGGINTTPYYGVNSWIAVLDMENFHFRPLDDTKLEKDLQTNGLDGLKSGYLSEVGMEIHHPTTHFVIKSVAGGAA